MSVEEALDTITRSTRFGTGIGFVAGIGLVATQSRPADPSESYTDLDLRLLIPVATTGLGFGVGLVYGIVTSVIDYCKANIKTVQDDDEDSEPGPSN